MSKKKTCKKWTLKKETQLPCVCFVRICECITVCFKTVFIIIYGKKYVRIFIMRNDRTFCKLLDRNYTVRLRQACQPTGYRCQSYLYWRPLAGNSSWRSNVAEFFLIFERPRYTNHKWKDSSKIAVPIGSTKQVN